MKGLGEIRETFERSREVFAVGALAHRAACASQLIAEMENDQHPHHEHEHHAGAKPGLCGGGDEYQATRDAGGVGSSGCGTGMGGSGRRDGLRAEIKGQREAVESARAVADVRIEEGTRELEELISRLELSERGRRALLADMVEVRATLSALPEELERRRVAAARAD